MLKQIALIQAFIEISLYVWATSLGVYHGNQPKYNSKFAIQVTVKYCQSTTVCNDKDLKIQSMKWSNLQT